MERCGRVPSVGDKPGARGDILAAHGDGDVVLDGTIVHPCADSYVGVGAADPGGAARVREQRKRDAYGALAEHPYEFVPLVAESYGRLGPAAMAYLGRLADGAAERDSACASWGRAEFVEVVLRELSASLARSVGRMYHASLQVRARAAGSDFWSGLARPTVQPLED